MKILILKVHYGKNRAQEEVIHSLEKTRSIVNMKFDNHEKIAKMVVLQNEWTIDNNLLTPSMKIKRNEVEKLYEHKYVVWYESKKSIVWL